VLQCLYVFVFVLCYVLPESSESLELVQLFCKCISCVVQCAVLSVRLPPHTPSSGNRCMMVALLL
jgi:hypothetical protein